jgi:acyl carrier protein
MEILTAEKQNKLLGLFCETLGRSDFDFSESTELKSLKIDSLSMLDLMIGLEDHFGCDVDPEKLATCRTVGDVMRIVEAGGQ